MIKNRMQVSDIFVGVFFSCSILW